MLSERRFRRTFNLSSGHEATGKQSRKALKNRRFLSQGWRWQLSTRRSGDGMQEASAKGKSAHPKGRSDAMSPDRPGTWPERVTGKDASPEPPQARIGKGTRSRPSDCARQRTSETSGFERAQQGRSESRMPARAPVTNLWQGRPQGAGSERLDIGRQAYPGAEDAEGSPEASRARGVHALVRVGSAAMPAPFALCLMVATCPARRQPPAGPRLRVAARKTALPRSTADAIGRKSRAIQRRNASRLRQAVAPVCLSQALQPRGTVHADGKSHQRLQGP